MRNFPFSTVSFAFLLLVFMFGCQSAKKEESNTMTQTELTTTLKEHFAKTSGEFALAFQEIGGEERELLINEKEHFHAASTMKTPVMIEVYKQAAAGKFSMSDSLMVKNEFYSIVDSSTYSLSTNDDSEDNLYAVLGEKRPISDLVYDMIIWSSNLATNLVIELVDAQTVTQTMRKMGAPDIQVLRGVEDIKAYEQGLNNTTTAYDLMAIFEQIARGNAVNETASEAMMTTLLDQKFNSIIPAKLPKEVKVAHKTGWISTVHHDSGIVILPNGKRYVLILLSKNWESDEAAIETMATVSKLIYDFVTQAP